ncbi:MAG TPA: DUF2007 domain-containing protein [Gemmatimonadaceae bacterium]|nr:DUF2007 domain-containing protein [Gemmatimonadaceae bacterium]
MTSWVQVATYASAIEAEIAVARLEASGIPARARGNDIVGIFGPGFQGSSARGVSVLVLAESAEAAKEILSHSDQ